MLPKILAKGPFLPENITIINNSSSQRKTTSEIEVIIDHTWSEIESKALSQNQMLWNGQSLRLDSLSLEAGNLILNTSITDYKQRIGLERNVDFLIEMGFDNNLSYLSSGLAIGGLVETIDGFFIFQNRSPKSIDIQKTDFIGGVMDRLEATTGLDLLEHNYQEIAEELNLERENIENIQILGLVLAHQGNVIVTTHTLLKIDSDKLEAIFNQTHDEEIQSLVKIPKEKLSEFMLKLGGYKPAVLELLI